MNKIVVANFLAGAESMKRNQAGFTLVELIIVIVILAILGATALPRMTNYTTQAHESSVAGVGGNYGTAVMLAHAQYIANSNSGAVTMSFDGVDVGMTANGWPKGATGAEAAAALTAAHCVSAWQLTMVNPPPVATAAADNIDYVASVSGNDCVYTYSNAANMTITYTTTTGSVAVDSDSSS